MFMQSEKRYKEIEIFWIFYQKILCNNHPWYWRPPPPQLPQTQWEHPYIILEAPTPKWFTIPMYIYVSIWLWKIIIFLSTLQYWTIAFTAHNQSDTICTPAIVHFLYTITLCVCVCWGVSLAHLNKSQAARVVREQLSLRNTFKKIPHVSLLLI